MSMDAPKKHKAIQEAPVKKADDFNAGGYFMYPPNKEHGEAVTVYASTQAEADEQYKKIIGGAKI